MVGSRISARVNVEPFSGLSAAVHPPRDPCPRAAVMSTLIITAKVPSPNCSGDRIPRVKRKETKPRSSKTLSLFLSRRCLLFLLERDEIWNRISTESFFPPVVFQLSRLNHEEPFFDFRELFRSIDERIVSFVTRGLLVEGNEAEGKKEEVDFKVQNV